MAATGKLDNAKEKGTAEPPATSPSQATCLLLAGMVAAWLAAGSVGLLAAPLRHALTWLPLAVAVLAGLPPAPQPARSWIVLAAGLALGLFFTSFLSPAVNVLAVAVVLASLAQIGRGLTGRAALLAALAATALGGFRIACDSVPTAWSAADAAGRGLGHLAGWLCGCRLEVGASFAGLDFLVLAAVVYAGWVVLTVPRATGLASATRPRATGLASARRRRALVAAAALAGGQVAYLLLAAGSQRLLQLLPPAVPPVLSDASHCGAWRWGDGLRTLASWDLPLTAALIQGTLVALVVRWGQLGWHVPEPPAKGVVLPRAATPTAPLRSPPFPTAPVLISAVVLAVAAVLLASLPTGSCDLHGKTILAYDDAAVDWRKPEYGSADDGRYGMLPMLVGSLGGRFTRSKQFAPAELAAADELLLIDTAGPLPSTVLDRVRNYVAGGGSLLLAGRGNDLLDRLRVAIRFERPMTRPIDGEQACEALPHAASAGFDNRRGCFGLGSGGSLRAAWPARPVIVGRWGWAAIDEIEEGVAEGADPGPSNPKSRNPAIPKPQNPAVPRSRNPEIPASKSPAFGQRLGDFPLAAQQSVGAGRVFVLADASPLENDRIADSYRFVGRLLGYLAQRGSSPQDGWRQAAALAALAALALLVAIRPAAGLVLLTATAMAVAVVCSAAAADSSSGVLPDGQLGPPIAYLDAGHLESYSAEPRSPMGLAGLTRMLARHGLLPLSAPDLASDGLGRARLLIVIGPARPFSAVERDAVKQFVQGGGTLLCLVGALEARGSESLLSDFGFRVPHSPVPPGDNAVEPWPLGNCTGMFHGGTWQAPFYAAWPVECRGDAEQLVFEKKSKASIVVARVEGNGKVVVIGDTHFAANANHLKAGQDMAPFWRWLLSRIVAGQEPWEPSAATAAGNAKAPADDEDDANGGDEDDEGPAARQPGAEGNR